MRTIILAGALALAAGAAQAVPIRYTIEGTGSGYFDGWTFNDSSVVLTLVADTDTWDGARMHVENSYIEVRGLLGGVLYGNYGLRYEGGRVAYEGWEFGGDSLSFLANVPFLQGFAETAGTDLRLSFYSAWTDKGLIELNALRDVSIYAQAIPEPGTALLTLAGLCGLLARRGTHRPRHATCRTGRSS